MVHLLKKKKERTKKIKETRDSRCIHQNDLGKACCQHDIAYGDCKDLIRRTVADKYYVLKHLIQLKIQNMMGIREILLDKFFDKETSGSGI